MKQSSAKRVPRHKHLLLDQDKIEKAQKALGARTETETIERALEIVIGEDEKNRRAWAATEKLVKNGIDIKDVFDHLNETVFDTSVYISAIRSGDAGILELRRASRRETKNSQPLWLSALYYPNC